MNTGTENSSQVVPKYSSIKAFLEVCLSPQWRTQPALMAPGREPLTYEGLHHHIRTTTDTLNQKGIGKNDAVAVVIPNGPEMASAFMAVLAGCTCAPLNPKYKAEEFEFYLTDLEAKALVIPKTMDSPAREVAEKLNIRVLDLITDPKDEAGRFTLEGEPIANKDCKPGLGDAEDTALVLHTSGTTSRPKIVPLSQRNIFTSAYNVGTSLKLTPHDRCLNVMPLFHIHGLIAALAATLNAGGSTVCTPGFEANLFFDWVDEFKPTWYTAVPTIHQAVITAAPEHNESVNNAPFRFLRSCSSSMPPQVMKQLEDLFDVPLVEAYGMSEAAHQISCNPLTRGKQKPGSVGLPAGPEAAIMDETGNLLPTGTTGEIVIKGENITTGYRNNDEANEKSFTNGWFRTGDEGRFDDEGYLYITGRLKEQINQGGEKIAPREIDEVLMDHEAVHQAVTFGVPHERLGETVAAVIVFKEGKHASEAELKAFATRRLAEHKVPRQIVFTDQIPKGPTGKLKRIGLHEKLEPLLKPGHVPPESETEFKLAALWSELLKIENIGRFDNFFMMGGHSLLATQAVSRINTMFNTEITIGQFFLQPTPGDLAHLIDSAAPKSSSEDFAKLLAEVEGLSEEDMTSLLDE